MLCIFWREKKNTKALYLAAVNSLSGWRCILISLQHIFKNQRIIKYRVGREFWKSFTAVLCPLQQSTVRASQLGHFCFCSIEEHQGKKKPLNPFKPIVSSPVFWNGFEQFYFWNLLRWWNWQFWLAKRHWFISVLFGNSSWTFCVR